MVHESIIIPQELVRRDSTTYIYRGFNPPQEPTVFSCGDRCINMWALKSLDYGENSTFYHCPITVSHVSNIYTSDQIVPDGVARLAASAIALEGRWAIDRPSNGTVWTQYQYYPFGYAIIPICSSSHSNSSYGKDRG